MTTRPVALVAALRAELLPAARAMQGARGARHDGQSFVTGELWGRSALLTWTGAGARAATAGARRTLVRLEELGWSDARVVVLGVAGGLSPSAHLGAVFGACRSRRFDPDHRETGCIDLAPATGSPAAELLTVDRVVTDPAAKHDLWRRLGAPAAAAVDMETFYSVERFSAAGLEVRALRAISDGPTDALPAWLADCVGDGGGLSQARVAWRALGRPLSWPALLELRRRVDVASGRLCESARTLLESWG
jgi:nucleoside phosphorylase